MVRQSSNRALDAILSLDADDERGAFDQATPPTLDARVDLYLRARFGSERNVTAEDRALARDRLLHAVATELFGDADEKGAEVHNRAVAPVAKTAVPLLRSRAGLLETLRDALLLPLLWPAHGGMQSRFVTASVAACLLAGAAWTATWFYAAKSVDTAIAMWSESEAKSGRTYACGSRSVGGFPLRVEVTCTEPKATVVLSERSTIVANAKQLKVVATLLQPGALATQITGPFSVAEPGRPANLVGDWTQAQATIRGAPDNLEQVSVILDGAQFYRVAKVNMQPVLTGDRLEITARPNSSSTAGKPVFDIAAHITGGSIPEGGPILSQTFAADISAVLHGAGNTGSKAIVARLRDWQSGGGRVDVSSATIEQGLARATAQGTLSLADNGGIEGTLGFTGGNLDRVAELLSGSASPGNQDQKMAASPEPNANNATVRSITRPNENPERDQKIPEETRRNRMPLRPETMPAINFSDGNAYFGSVLLGRIPPLY
jgi:hypothetical protein